MIEKASILLKKMERLQYSRQYDVDGKHISGSERIRFLF
jgi:hypothetical protein